MITSHAGSANRELRILRALRRGDRFGRQMICDFETTRGGAFGLRLGLLWCQLGADK
ncbi:MAG: hypothetical protein P8J02_04735 [Yoonia sp.]|nr:hypothetical protein [Yoonia sp.]